MSQNLPLVSAVILNFRAGRAAAACARNLLQQSIAEQMEILIVDNHSDDDSIGFLRAQFANDPKVRIVETRKNLGFGGGYGEGARQARGEFLLINNPEKTIEESGVERMIQKMESDSTIGILAPKLVHNDGTVRYSARAFPTPLDVIAKRTTLGKIFPGHLRRYLDLGKSVNEERDTDWIAGGCLMMRRTFFEGLGGFDPRFFLFFEDIDLCRRCWQAGKRVVYFPSVTASDRKRRLSEGGVFSMIGSRVGRIHIASAVKYFLKWGTGTKRMA